MLLFINEYEKNKRDYYNLKCAELKGAGVNISTNEENNDCIVEGKHKIKNIGYTDKEKEYVNKHIKYLVHWTTVHNFKKIMKHMEIRSKILTKKSKNKKDINWQYDYIVFASEITNSESNNMTLFKSQNNNDGRIIGILIDKNILFDNDVYYYYSKIGMCGYADDTIPNHNIKKIICHKYYDDMIKYIKELKINSNLKYALLLFSGEIEDNPHPCRIFDDRTRNLTLDQLGIDESLKRHGEHEFCFFDRIDLKKHLFGIDLSYVDKDDYDEIKKMIPSDTVIQTNNNKNFDKKWIWPDGVGFY